MSLKPKWEVGGVLGGVMGSKAEPEVDGESVLSSVRLSGASFDEVAEDPDMYVERRAIPVSPRAVVK
jgi:hypothetical protein